MNNQTLKARNPAAQEIFDNPYKMRYYNLLQAIKSLYLRLKK